MTFFPEPLKPSEGRKEDPLIVDPIEADKKAKDEEGLWSSTEKKSSSIYGAFLFFINNLIDNLTDGKDDSLNIDSQDPMAQSVQSLQSIFEALKEANLSENSQFSQKFSEVWYTLLENLQIHERMQRQAYINVDKLKTLAIQMGNYPPNADQKLGFYLERSTGKHWLPQPFVNILKQLHLEYRNHQQSSHLQVWSDLITEILQG